MNAVITKKQKNTIMIFGGITGVFGVVAGASGLYLREKYLMLEQDWDVDSIPGFTKGYFGCMSGFLLFLMGTVGFSLVYTRMSCLVFIYWLLSLSCDTLAVLDAMMVLPFTIENGDYAWKKPYCYKNETADNFAAWNQTKTTPSNLDFTQDYCSHIKEISMLLMVVTITVLTSLLFSSLTTFITSAALCRARSIAESAQAAIQLAPFSQPNDFQPMSFNNVVYQSDGFKK
ncbi:uncharacterized protein LOC124435430 [Xenia sp. Carnegie-2017]|uniref:uncharacterized protein LOC124435430 n=1 Tax=Xenia sp. Carnegie-2017 TaxID=2897299 RepID=UPI001F0467D4|nr:uncharacterized protein LOC124435430 [Xenia sp. Carnegie-2017]